MPDSRGTVLVTGASRRLGRMIALAAARDGWDVAIHVHRHGPDGDETREAVCALGRAAEIVAADLGDADDVRALVGNAAQAMGRAITGLVNCASHFAWDDSTTLNADRFATHMAVNSLAPMLLAAELMRLLPDDAEASVVNILDFKLSNPDRDFLSYTLSKYALAGATEVLARDFAPRGRVNAVAPGYILPAPDQPVATFEALSARTPMGRRAAAEDVAAAAAFLLGNASITGQKLTVDCGLHMMSRDRDVGRED